MNDRARGTLSYRRMALLMVVAAVMVSLLASCSSGSGSGAPPAGPGSSVRPGPDSVVLGGSAAPPVTFATNADAASILEGLAPTLAATAEERACAGQKLSADARLLDQARGGVVPGSGTFESISGFVVMCRREAYGRQMAQDLAADHPGITAEQQACVTREYVALSEADLDAVVVAAAAPSGSAAPRGVAAIERILSECAIPKQ